MTMSPELSTDEVLISFDGGIAEITLNRPEQLNSITPDVIKGIGEAFKFSDESEEVKVVILTGKGKAFSAGVDLKAVKEDSSLLEPESFGLDSPGMKAILGCKKPVIGAVNGFAVTGGLEIALACDFIYAAETAKFADTHALVGLVPGWGLSQRMSRLMGINRARELSFTGRYFSADEAKLWGMVNEVFPAGRLMFETRKIAEHIAGAHQGALYQIKSMMTRGASMDLESGLIMEGEIAGEFNQIDYSVLEARLEVLRQKAR